MFALVAFAGMMAWFMVKASQNPEPLVTEDYYGEELRFQTRIDAMERARSLSAPVRIAVERKRALLDFPPELDGQLIEATLLLLRPNAPAADRTVTFAHDTTSMEINVAGLLPGRYNARISWTVNGVVYLTEEKVFVP